MDGSQPFSDSGDRGRTPWQTKVGYAAVTYACDLSFETYKKTNLGVKGKCSWICLG
jgi:hypothetical protein